MNPAQFDSSSSPSENSITVGSEGESNGFDIPGKIIEPPSVSPNPEPDSKIRRRKNTDFRSESQQEIAEIGDSVDQITKAKNIMEMIRAAKQPKPSREIESVPSRMPNSSRPTNLPYKKSSHSTVHLGWLHKTIDGDDAVPAGSKSHANVMVNPMPNSIPTGSPSIVEDPPSSNSPTEPKFVVKYHDIKISKYTNVPSITEKTRRELYDDLLLENVEVNTSYSEFDPIDYGHKICRIEKDGQTLLDVEIDTDLKRQITFPNSVEPIPQHSILFDVPELHGYTDKDSYGIGLISSCTDECKATYTWYRGGNMVKRGQSLYWIATAGDGLFSCDVECHASING